MAPQKAYLKHLNSELARQPWRGACSICRSQNDLQCSPRLSCSPGHLSSHHTWGPFYSARRKRVLMPIRSNFWLVNISSCCMPVFNSHSHPDPPSNWPSLSHYHLEKVPQAPILPQSVVVSNWCSFPEGWSVPFYCWLHILRSWQAILRKDSWAENKDLAWLQLLSLPVLGWGFFAVKHFCQWLCYC